MTAAGVMADRAAKPGNDAVRHVQSVIDWLVDGARTAKTPPAFLAELCGRLCDCGLPLHRVAAFVRTLHPDVLGRGFIWRPDEEVQVISIPIDMTGSPELRHNPVRVVMQTGTGMRRRISAPDCPDDFKIISDLRAEGVTDYIIQPLIFTNGEYQAVSWTTTRTNGFTDEDLAALEAVRTPLSRMAEIYALRRTASTLLDSYVGRGSGERILAGHIRRGDVESIDAVVLLADLRGFTRISNERSGLEVIAILNSYFDCLVPPIESHGGEVLKFIGDGLLAIFPVGRESGATTEVCAAALAAAIDASRQMSENESTRTAMHGQPLRFGMALHIGEILYGNIGGSGRLDFTAVGPAVNLTARLEKLAGELGRELVFSSEFAGRCREPVVSLGSHAMRGFTDPHEVFAPA